ncbi:hypothetical protein [Rhodoferax mekongensis]|uniref:hypothetical protein n=1 Tax=Rhodoferax mekongensis TaxID=3068341 RepID=UPI0028BE9C0A|nr:hypothetical protein [Rhodoferax sp. TBRC 17199]MDT7517136.1 hypothetical protein [Rhodoferax sp. TBRC 17199]
MNSTRDRKKSISLIFRGFDLTAQEVASLVEVMPSRLGNRGEPVKPGVKTRLVRSYVGFSMDFSNDYALCDMVPAFLAHLGGVDHLCQIKNQVRPEFFEIDCHLPVGGTDDIQDGHFPTTVIADIFKLGATLGLSFF